MEINLYNGDCKEVLKKFESNFIDTIITDPPYGLNFMNKKWDYDVPSVETWKECLRVLKPGGTALIFAGSRTQHRMAVNVEDAGFILKDCIMWIYGSGFPKATDISKQIDKMAEKDREVIGNNPNKRNAHKKGSMAFDKGLNKKEHLNKMDITKPATPKAQLWDGWNSHGLKPAYEPIIVAMKPNDGSYADNALKHGVAGLNIDGGRIETNRNNERQYDKEEKSGTTNSNKSIFKMGGKQIRQDNWLNKGRYPSNIILDEEAAALLDKQTGNVKGWTGQNHNSFNPYGGNALNESQTERQGFFEGYNDDGGASRFFYTAKASASERNNGLEEMEPQQTNDGREKDIDNAYQRGKTLRNNFHPTVKPLSLITYLCKLTKTPTGGNVCDPFMGSGTTGMGCKVTLRNFYGIEIEKPSFELAKTRIHNFEPQMELFD